MTDTVKKTIKVYQDPLAGYRWADLTPEQRADRKEKKRLRREQNAVHTPIRKRTGGKKDLGKSANTEDFAWPDTVNARGCMPDKVIWNTAAQLTGCSVAQAGMWYDAFRAIMIHELATKRIFHIACLGTLSIEERFNKPINPLYPITQKTQLSGRITTKFTLCQEIREKYFPITRTPIEVIPYQEITSIEDLC